jgi:hypothetical protein
VSHQYVSRSFPTDDTRADRSTMRKQFRLHVCKVCGRSFEASPRRRICSPECRNGRAPAVYRFVCPDGRSYVGAVGDSRNRAKQKIARSNSRLLTAFEQYPPETWTYEVLERLPLGCSKRDLREAEQRHIDRLRSWAPDVGFNIVSAVWEGDGPAQRAGRQSPPSSAASLTMTASRSVEQQLTPEFAQALTGPITIFGGLHRE